MGKLMPNVGEGKLKLPFYQEDVLPEDRSTIQEYLKSIDFTRMLRTPLTALSTILKIVCLLGVSQYLQYTKSWMCFILFAFYFIQLFPWVMHFVCGDRYVYKAWVLQELNISDLRKDPITYGVVWETILYMIIPIYFQIEYPGHLKYDYCIPIAGFVIVIMDCFALYNYAHIDNYLLIPNRDDMTLYKCYEDNYDQKILTILESTPTYIRLKNISTENLKPDFRITRQFINSPNTVSVNFKEDALIPPGARFTIATTEFKGAVDNGEHFFTIKKLRSFGPNVDKKVKTSIRAPRSQNFEPEHLPDMSNPEKDAYVQLVEIYETEEERKIREAKENIPIPSTTRSVERNYRFGIQE